MPRSGRARVLFIDGFINLLLGVALLWEGVRGDGQLIGLGLGGAIAINLCGGLVLTGWPLFGELRLPLRGQVLLWGLASILVLISLVELGTQAGRHREDLR